VIKVSSPIKSDIDKIVAFIAKKNSNSSTHISWLGEDSITIKKQLLEFSPNFVDSFLIIRDEDGLVGVVGFYVSSEQKVARLLGPYVEGKWSELSDEMFNEIVKIIPGYIERLIIAPSSKNKSAIKFATDHGFRKYNEELKLVMKKENFKESSSRMDIRKLSKGDFEDFEKIHHKGVYFTAREVFARLDNRNVVFGVYEKYTLIGYVYIELEVDSAYVHFINILEDKRNKGVGKGLLMYCVSWAFTNKGIDEVNLSVRPDNKARKLFESVGFKEGLTVEAYDKNI